MKIALLTNEYPPHVYGGAGVHVEYLTRALAAADGGRHHVEVLSFGNQSETAGNLSVRGVGAPQDIAVSDPRHARFFDTIGRNLVMAGAVRAPDVVHCHTWYSHFAGCLAKKLYGARLVLTTHSLEPHRPWKSEQLGTGYQASTWIEETAYRNADGVVAVSQAMKSDVQALYDVPEDRVRVIHNGIDVDEYRPRPDAEVLRKHGIDPDIPFVLFVGRITRQKGIVHLVHALRYLDSGMQVVLCAGAPDTPEIAREMNEAVDEARATTENPIVWIDAMLPRPEVITLYTEAAVFVCPSVYEPFGIINLEAMACETPVVASAVGGIPEVVLDGETGLLVSLETIPEQAEAADPGRFARALAHSINKLMGDDALRAEMGRRSRRRVEDEFSWTQIAARTLGFYSDLVGS